MIKRGFNIYQEEQIHRLNLKKWLREFKVKAIKVKNKK